MIAQAAMDALQIAIATGVGIVTLGAAVAIVAYIGAAAW
jgi:hypothetical protein